MFIFKMTLPMNSSDGSVFKPFKTFAVCALSDTKHSRVLTHLLCLTPDDFTRQGGSAATQWVNHADYLPMHPIKRQCTPMCPALLFYSV
jgi:hypothetical protein